jgi:hypothetical protein
MKNIQVIDGALNCVYDVFAAADDDHALIFANGTDVAFAEDLARRSDVDRVTAALERLWTCRIQKAQAMGIHGIQFYELAEKRQYYPSLKDEEAVNPDGSSVAAGSGEPGGVNRELGAAEPRARAW